MRAPLHQVALGNAFDRMGVDILGPFPKTARGNKFVLVAVDYFTKWPEAIALPNQEAGTVAEALVENVFSRVGVPLEIHTDQGRNFESVLVQEVARVLGFQKTRSTPLHPQSGGLVERLNRTLTKHLAQFVEEDQRTWDQKIPLFLLAYRSAAHATTGLSPAQLVYGRDLRLPDVLVRPPPQTIRPPTTEYAIQLRHYLEQVRAFAQQQATLKMRSQKESFDRHARHPQFKEDDWVWVYNPQRKKGLCPKLQPAWTGPWIISKKKNDVLFEVSMGGRSDYCTQIDWRVPT
ncbi:unnamed protein product, partial [Nesidiocoris tenuis]